MRRARLPLVVVALVGVLGVLAAASLRGGASSASTVAPSARPAANAFAHAYVSLLNGASDAAALPDVSAGTRATAAAAGGVPAPYRGRVVLRRVAFSGVLGARRASALLIAAAGSRTLEATLWLTYADGRWQVSTLVPPDFTTVFSPPAPPVRVPPAARQAADAFAIAYADYRTGAQSRPPAGLPTLRHQLAAGQDPLHGLVRTGARARLVDMQLLPQGQLAPVDAVVTAGGRRLAFTFILEQSGGHWQVSQFPVSVP